MKEYGDIDSKFRFVTLVSKRAKQLLKGAKPRIKSKSRNLIHVALEEVKKGLVDYELIRHKVEDVHDVEEDIFIGEELIGSAAEDEEESVAAKKEAKPVKGKKKGKKKN